MESANQRLRWELVKRGHLLVADDAVELYLRTSIVGKAPEVLTNL